MLAMLAFPVPEQLPHPRGGSRGLIPLVPDQPLAMTAEADEDCLAR